jgi:hypothetical protein
MGTSDVARLRQQIEEECQAMQLAMTGFAQTASHEVIHQRFQHLDMVQHQLALLIGEQEATQIVVETYVKNMG